MAPPFLFFRQERIISGARSSDCEPREWVTTCNGDLVDPLSLLGWESLGGLPWQSWSVGASPANREKRRSNQTFPLHQQGVSSLPPRRAPDPAPPQRTPLPPSRRRPLRLSQQRNRRPFQQKPPPLCQQRSLARFQQKRPLSFQQPRRCALRYRQLVAPPVRLTPSAGGPTTGPRSTAPTGICPDRSSWGSGKMSPETRRRR